MVSKHHGFTLVELLVVIAILTILAGLLMPALRKAIYEARLISDVSNQRQIAVGVTQYTSDNADYYPTAYDTSHPQAAFNPMRTVSGVLLHDYRADLIDYFGGSVKGVWTCPNARLDVQGKGTIQGAGGYSNGPQDLDTMTGGFMSYSFFFGRVPKTGTGSEKCAVSSGGFAPPKPMRKIGQPFEVDALLYKFGGGKYQWHEALGNRIRNFRVLSADYYRVNGGRWRYMHESFTGAPLGVGSLPVNGARGTAESVDGAGNIPGFAYYDYTFANDDGSAKALRQLTGADFRLVASNPGGYGIPNVDEVQP